MSQLELALLLAAALTGALVGRTLLGYGRAGLMATFGVAFAAAVLTAFVTSFAGLPRIIPPVPGVSFPVGWSFLGAILAVGGPASLIRALAEDSRPAPTAAPATRRTSMADLAATTATEP